MKILFVDDDPNRHRAFAASQPSDVRAHMVFTPKSALKHIEKHVYDLMSLDHDLYDKSKLTGLDVARKVACLPKHMRPLAVVVHSHNQMGSRLMVNELLRAGIPAFAMPFGMFPIHAWERGWNTPLSVGDDLPDARPYKFD
jgi:CheY-like chemotaxis protein